MVVITKCNRNGSHGSTICDFWLWLTSKMADNKTADPRWSQNVPCSQTSSRTSSFSMFSEFSNILFNLILGGFNLILHKVNESPKSNSSLLDIFTFIGIVVIDVNECENAGTHACYWSEGCNNTRGGYTCFCDAGYIVDPDDSFNCQGEGFMS